LCRIHACISLLHAAPRHSSCHNVKGGIIILLSLTGSHGFPFLILHRSLNCAEDPVLFYLLPKIRQLVLHSAGLVLAFHSSIPIFHFTQPCPPHSSSTRFHPSQLKSFKLATLRKSQAMTNDNAIVRLLYAILSQKCLKDASIPIPIQPNTLII
jgi:hypothetical protein